ncbi:MAG: hypothetical protein IJ180_10230 [Bacteroidales bacterium]|nr:hypothetical protein [Bacteroidales bacterium]
MELQSIFKATIIILVPTLLAVGGIIWGLFKDKEYKRRKKELEIEKNIFKENTGIIYKEMYFTLQEMNNNTRKTFIWVRFWSVLSLIGFIISLIISLTLTRYKEWENF